jgi:hypothetical protein
MTSAYLIWSRGLPARHAAGAVPTVRPEFDWNKQPAGGMGYR